MADIEVENVLREIRERVYAEQEASTSAGLSADSGSDTSRKNDEPASDNLARLESYLATTGRAWDRLPPLVSNRSGTPARLELWLKRHLKRATRWYAWEQVNFNAAVHHALHEMMQALSAYENKLADQRERLLAETASRKAESAARETENAASQMARRAELQQYQVEVERLRSELNTQQKLIAERQASTEAQTDARNAQVDGKLAAIVSELRETTGRLQEEQRVSYKQLILEASEATVLEDRARRKTEALLEQLQRRIEQLEK